MKNIIFIMLCWFALSTSSNAQDLVYTPKNPAFGGQTFNYQWLLNSAQAQNSHEDPDLQGREERSSIDQFSESLNRQLLSRLSRQLFTEQFGEEGLQEGTFQFGEFQLDVTQDIDGMVITIFDGQGGETKITVPFP